MIKPHPLRAAFAVVLTVVVSGCDHPPPLEPPPVRRGEFQRGMNLACWTEGCFRSAPLDFTFHKMTEDGVEWVSLVVTAFQNRAEDDYIAAPAPAELEEEIAAVARQARIHGFRLTLKPHIDLRDGAWRGNIEPANRDRWFENYRRFVNTLALLADRHGIEQLVVGTELVKLSRYEDRWRRLIADVRARYRGSLLYAASWNEFESVGYWDALDLAGIDAYFPLTDRRDPELIDLLAGWEEWIGKLEVWHAHVGKPVVFTEIGYSSRDGTNMHPYRFDLQEKLDMQEQADCYRAALHAFADMPFLRGVYWWYWRVDSGGGAYNGDYPPTAKPAELVLRQAWRQPSP